MINELKNEASILEYEERNQLYKASKSNQDIFIPPVFDVFWQGHDFRLLETPSHFRPNFKSRVRVLISMT